MPDGSTSALALRRALTGLAFPLSEEVRAQLWVRVSAYTDDMRAQGWPPERVIVAMERLTNDAGLYASPRIVWSQEVSKGPDSLIVEMVGWCIEHYYKSAGH